MAQVDFTAGEFAEWFRSHRGPNADPNELYQRMQEAETHREVYRALEEISHEARLHGVESVAVPEGAANPDQACSYVNTGETYDLTVLYDEGTSTFMLTSWGDWLERAEAALHEAGVPARDDEDVCTECGRVYPMDMMVLDVNEETGQHEATCNRCIREREERNKPPTWTPMKNEPLIAMLRSIEGMPIAVHYVPEDNRAVATDPDTLAFSFPASNTGTFIAAFPDEPFVRTWPGLVDAFERKKMDELYVIDSVVVGVSQGIEREMFSRLRVAMDAFFETGMQYQPLRYMLETPPILWTCDQVNEIHWIMDGRNRDGIQAFVRREEEVGSTIQSSDLVVWSAGTDEVAELIEDGFIKWGDDRTLREYLQQIGVCRAR